MTPLSLVGDAIAAVCVVLVVPWLAMWGLPIIVAIIGGAP